MITIFNRKAIYIGYSKEEKNKIIKLLTKYKIPYEKKRMGCQRRTSQGARRSGTVIRISDNL